jgi:hypothetical protein
MLSFGLAVAARFDGHEFKSLLPAQRTFYRELKPISDQFDPASLKAAHLDREALKARGRLPEDAMTEAAHWVRAEARGHRPVFVGFPAAYDWLFLYWYFVRFGRLGSPFDFSSVLDMKTMFHQKAGVVLSSAGKDDLPAEIRPQRPHTHNALDDALEQGELFVRLHNWVGVRTMPSSYREDRPGPPS